MSVKNALKLVKPKRKVKRVNLGEAIKLAKQKNRQEASSNALVYKDKYCDERWKFIERLATGIYLYENLTYNTKTGNVYITSYFGFTETPKRNYNRRKTSKEAAKRY